MPTENVLGTLATLAIVALAWAIIAYRANRESGPPARRARDNRRTA